MTELEQVIRAMEQKLALLDAKEKEIENLYKSLGRTMEKFFLLKRLSQYESRLDEFSPELSNLIDAARLLLEDQG